MHWKRTRTGIMYDIKTDKDAIDFALKLKALDGKDNTSSTVRAYLFPSLNNDTESAVMVTGHHTYQDGIS